MSKSRSATPKPNILPSINTSPSIQSTTSRPFIHENTPPGHYFEERDSELAVRTVSPRSFHRPPPQASSHASSSHRPAEAPADEPMSKRLRRGSPQRRQSSPSPSSDSQDGMADTETDASRNQQSEVPQPPAKPQPKKKRTRTLTTPHQSAVLHALLAQSRFPTTAMREEVGRSIGLSARKVQIWFQNQRQKARRPRSHSETSRPAAHHGPFPAGSDPSSINPFAMSSDQGPSSGIPQLGHVRARGYEDDHFAYSGHHSPGSFASSLNSPPQLSGPGVPGMDYRPYQERPETASASSYRPDPSSSTSRPYTNPTSRIVRSSPSYSPPSPRPTTTGRLRDRDFSRTLPPLNFASLPSRGRPSIALHGAPLPYAPIPSYHRSYPSTPESSFAHRPPESFSRPSLTLPPPFALQPSPRWDNSPSTPVRFEPLAGPRLCVLPGNNSPVTLPSCTDMADPEAVNTFRRDTTLPPRPGRYDPVRATFVRTTSNPSPPPLAQETGGEPDVGDHRD